MLISLFLGNWRIILAGAVVAGLLYKVDYRAYHSGYDNAMLQCSKEVDKVVLVQQEACLKQSELREKSNAAIVRSKDSILARFERDVKRLRAVKDGQGNREVTAPSLDTGSADSVQLPAESGSISQRILELGRDAAIRSAEFEQCREFVLGQ